MARSRDERNDGIDEVLRELTYWRRLTGPEGGAPSKSTGEAPSRISELERQLRSRGVAVHWDGEEYIRDEPPR
jgi:hypothetical protein